MERVKRLTQMPRNTILTRGTQRDLSHRRFILPSLTHHGSVELILLESLIKMSVDAMVTFTLDQLRIQEANQLMVSKNSLNGSIKLNL